MNLCEDIEDDKYEAERAEFLETCEYWAGEVENNEFENTKGEFENTLLRLAHIAEQYTHVDFKSLFRGTRGITRKKATAMLKYNRSVTFDMSESVLTSWTTNPQIAERFASKNGGVVLQYNTDDLEVFLSFADLWRRMSRQEQETYRDIHLPVEEAEVLVKNPPSLTVTSRNIYRFTPDRRLRDKSGMTDY